MTKATLIYNARLLDEANDTPGAVLVVNGKFRSVFHGYYTDADTVVSLSKAVLKEDGDENNWCEYLMWRCDEDELKEKGRVCLL